MNQLRKALLIVPLMFLATWPVGQVGIVAAGHENLVSLTATQLGEQHCQNYPDAFSVSLKLGIRLRNESREKVIVAKKLSSPFRVTVSTSLEELNQGRFVYSPSVLEVSNENPKLEKFGDRPDSERFVILDPGAEFEVEMWTTLIADLTISKRPTANYGPTAGKYFMQLQLRAWPYAATTKSEIQKLREAWRSSGVLSTAAIESQPFVITLPEIQRSISCGEEKHSSPKK